MTNRADADTITDDQISQLRNEAAESGDGLQVAICDLALLDDSADLSHAPEIDESLRAGLERLGIVPEHVDCTETARRACVAAIDNARAQEV